MGDVHPELGRVVSRHEGRMLAGGWLIYVGAILVATGVMHVASFLESLLDGAPDVSDAGTALFALAAGAAMLARCVYLWKQRLAIHEHGFVLTRLTGTKVVRFSEIARAEAATHHDKLGSVFELELDLGERGFLTLTSALEGLEGVANVFVTKGGSVRA